MLGWEVQRGQDGARRCTQPRCSSRWSAPRPAGAGHRSGDRQRVRRACGLRRRGAAGPHVAPERSRSGGPAQRCGACPWGRNHQHPAAARSRPARGRLAGRPRRRHRLHQHDPHRPLGGDRGAVGGGPGRILTDRSRPPVPLRAVPGRWPAQRGQQRRLRRVPARARSGLGVCDREAVSAEAVRPGMVLAERVTIPANNLRLIRPRTRNWWGIRHTSARLHIEFSWTNVAHSAGEPDATAEAARAPGGSPCRWNAAFRAGPSPCSQSPD